MNLSLEEKGNDYCFNTFFKHNKSPMLIIHPTTLKIVETNDAACKLYGYTYDKMLALRINQINIAPEEEIRDNIKKILLNHFAGYTCKHSTSENKIIHVKLNSSIIKIDDMDYIQSVVYNISDEMEEVSEIKKVSSYMQLILDNMPYLAWLKDLEGNYVAINKPFEEYCGLKREEILGKGDYDLFGRVNAETYIRDDQLIIAGRLKSLANERYEKDRKGWFEEFKSPIYDREGKIIGTVGALKNISERKNRENKIREAEERERQLLNETIDMKDNFITLISHEFRTPITVINAAVQTMETICSHENSCKAQKYIKKIKANLLRQQRLVNNLLDITKIKTNRLDVMLKEVDIVAYTREITESAKLYARQKGLEISFLSTFDKLMMLMDLEKYERIILNLLSNSIKFSHENGKIEVNLYTSEGFLKIDVKDRGMGIPEDKQDIIFDNFGQADNSTSRLAEGSGVGLYLVKSFVEALNGGITFTSIEGKGSTFKVILPIRKEKSESKISNISEDRIKHAVSLELSDII